MVSALFKPERCRADLCPVRLVEMPVSVQVKELAKLGQVGGTVQPQRLHVLAILWQLLQLLQDFLRGGVLQKVVKAFVLALWLHHRKV